jgi:hypothetical protein
MNLLSLCKHLPEDIVKYILSYDKNIVIRHGIIKIINKLNKQLYEKSYKLLMKKPLPIMGRTTINNNIIYTWCTVKLRLDNLGEHYIDYSCNSDMVMVTTAFWGKTNIDSRVNGVRRFEKIQFILP